MGQAKHTGEGVGHGDPDGSRGEAVTEKAGSIGGGEPDSKKAMAIFTKE